MRLSTRLAVQKFFKKRDFVFTDPSFLRKIHTKTYLFSLAFIPCMFLWIHEFLYPTPDIQFDVLRIVSPDFDKFVISNGIGAYHPYHESGIATFHYSERAGNRALMRHDITRSDMIERNVD